MKKDLADYLTTKREIETIMYDEGDRFMYDLSHLPEILQRWTEYREAKKKNALKLDEIQKIINDHQSGKGAVEHSEAYEDDKKNRDATAEEILDVGSKMKTALEITNGPIAYATELGQEISNLKKVAFTALAVGVFDILFLD